MKIGVVSDTHDDVVYTEKAIRVFKERKVELVLHLGDFISPPIVRMFEPLGVSMFGIFGNNDGYKEGLIEAFVDIGGKLEGSFKSLRIDGLKIALYHGEFMEISEALAMCGGYDVVFVGHDHKFEKKTYGKTFLINPGSCHRSFTKDGSPTVGIFDTGSREIECVDLI